MTALSAIAKRTLKPFFTVYSSPSTGAKRNDLSQSPKETLQSLCLAA
jgi:hypothetical protein